MVSCVQGLPCRVRKNMSSVYALNSYIRSPYPPNNLGGGRLHLPQHYTRLTVWCLLHPVLYLQVLLLNKITHQKLGELAVYNVNSFSQIHSALRMLLPEFLLCYLSMSLMQMCYMTTVCMSYNPCLMNKKKLTNQGFLSSLHWRKSSGHKQSVEIKR